MFDALIASDEASFASFETKETRIKWVNKGYAIAVPHMVLGSSPKPGGQWSSRISPDDTDEKSLSYAEMLSLPGYSFTEFFRTFTSSKDGLLSFTRPKRGDIANYYDAYSKKMHILDSFKPNTVVTGVDLLSSVDSLSPIYVVNYIDTTNNSKHSLQTNRVVLASGVFEKPLNDLADIHPQGEKTSLTNCSENTCRALNQHNQPFSNDKHIPIISPPKNFCDITTMEASIIVPPCPPPIASSQTVLILGTGVSAAEAVNHCAQYPGVHVIHMYRWSDEAPGPLRRFSNETYPEFARVYKLMKRAVVKNETIMTPDFFSEGSTYECLPNSCILEMSPCGRVTIQLEMTGELITRTVSSIKVCTGRSGSLAYLSPAICKLAGFPSGDKHCTSTTSDVLNLNSVSKTFLQPYLFSGRSNSSVTLSRASSGNTADESISSAPTSCSSSCCDVQCFSDPVYSNSSVTSVTSVASSIIGDEDCQEKDKQDEEESIESTGYSLRLGPGLYAIGSLTGETLVRLMLGGCAWVAGDIFRRENEIIA